MHLEEFRKKRDLSQHEFGLRLNPPVSQSLVSQWECGETRVTLDYALEIGRATNNEVTPEDCASMYIDRAEKKVF